MSASLAFQTASRGILIADAGVMALIPADNIVDANGRPEIFPKINMGEDQELPGEHIVGRYTHLISTFHIWVRESGLAGTKAIGGAVRKALIRQTWTQGDFHCEDTRLVSARYLRDPDGITGHGVITFEAWLEDRS